MATSDEIIANTYDAVTRRAEEGIDIAGLSTGLHELDFLTGGLRRQQVVVVGGRPILGKTTLALNLDPPNGSWRRDRASMSGA